MDNQLSAINLDEIAISSTNPRKHLNKDRLAELAESIKKHGVIQPITIRPKGDTETDVPFELVSGERRYRASKMAGLEKIPAYIKQMSDEEAFEVQLIENLQREDVHPMDEARGYRKMIEARGMSHPDIAERMDKSLSYVTRRLKMNALIEPLVEMFYEDLLAIGHARELCRLSEDTQQEIYEIFFSDPDAYNFMPTVNELKNKITRDYLLDIEEALFEAEDESLYPAAGPCSSCPKYSANNPSLFPDMNDGARCTDKACFDQKTHLHLVGLIEKYKDDPNYYFCSPKEDAPITEYAREAGVDLKDKYDDLLTYFEGESDLRVVYLSGWSMGEIEPVRLNVSGTKAEREEQLPRKEYLQQEIQRIEERRDRKVELDREKVQKAIIDQLPSDPAFNRYGTTSNWLRELALCWVLYDGCSWDRQAAFQVQVGLLEEEDENNLSTRKSAHEVLEFLRECRDDELSGYRGRLLAGWVMTNCTSASYLDPQKYPEAQLMRQFGQHLIPDAVEEAEKVQAEKREKRESRYEQQLKELREELQQLQPQTAKEN